MRYRTLNPEFLEELRATEKREQEKREAQFEEERKRQAEKDRLRVAGLRAEKTIRRSAQIDYQQEVVGTDAIVEKIHGKGEQQFKRGQVLGRYKVVSDGAMLVHSTESARGSRGKLTLRVRCVCNESKYVLASYARSMMKKNVANEWGCQSRKCLNAWREKQARKRKP